jgi:multidrug efflux system membrane fusion protein
MTPRRRALLLSSLALLAIAAGALYWTRRTPAEPPQRPPRIQAVAVAPVQRQDIRLTVQAIGNITAANLAVVKAKVEGELKVLHFREGQSVQAGAVLAELDRRPFEIALAQVEGQLARDQAQLQNARLDLTRFRDLLAKDGIAKQQVDTQEALVRQLQGTVQISQAAVDNARLQLSYTRITAPISGRVGLKQVDLGNTVKPADAAGLLTIAQTAPVNVVFAVPDQHLPAIQAVLASGQPLPVEAWDRELKHRLASGRVASTDNTIDTTTGTIRLKAAFPNSDGTLFPNQFVNVRLQLGRLEGALAVPAAALLRNGEGSFVYVVKDDRTVAARPVKAGPVDGERVAVEGDLRPGDPVVIDGTDRIRDGAKVQVIEPVKAGASGPRNPDGRERRRREGRPPAP